MRKSYISVFFIILCQIGQLAGQSKLRIGFQAGGVLSKSNGQDTLADNFTRRNRLGGTLGIQSIWDIKRGFSLNFGINYVNKGYKINNDTLGSSASVVLKTNSLNIPIGISFKQNFNTSNFIYEKFGIIGNYNFGSDSTTVVNNKSTPTFRITQIRQNTFYPMFYLGIGIGGIADNGDRYEFGITYNQSFSKDANSRVEYGSNYKQSFPVSFRGGFLQVSFTYYFDLTNFKKSNDYFE